MDITTILNKERKVSLQEYLTLFRYCKCILPSHYKSMNHNSATDRDSHQPFFSTSSNLKTRTKNSTCL